MEGVGQSIEMFPGQLQGSTAFLCTLQKEVVVITTDLLARVGLLISIMPHPFCISDNGPYWATGEVTISLAFVEVVVERIQSKLFEIVLAGSMLQGLELCLNSNWLQLSSCFTTASVECSRQQVLVHGHVAGSSNNSPFPFFLYVVCILI